VASDLAHGRATHLPPQLADLRRRCREAAVVCDFDGTLAPIVDDPAMARPLPGALIVLRALVERFLLVAVVSGRPAAFLATHLPVPGLTRVGSYGLEQVTEEGVTEVAGAAAWRAAVAEAVARAGDGPPPGVIVEDKGLSVTLHHRRAPAAAGWVRAFADAAAARGGLVVHDARMSIELRPPIAVDKGTVVSGLLAGAAATAVCVCGDDGGDLPAFAAVATLPVAVRVAAWSAEAPPELLAAADLVVRGPDGVLEVLRFLAG